MVKIDQDGNQSIKLTLFGAAKSGKTTAVETLHRMTEDEDKRYIIKPVSELKKIDKKDGSTLYFDRGIFQSTFDENRFYQIYTVAGQVNFFPLRKKVFQGTDGVIFVFDSQRDHLEKNIQALKELRNIANPNLISKIPLLVMANKQDLTNVMRKKEIEQILEKEGIIYPLNHPLAMWNPIIYETIAINPQEPQIYKVFAELIRRITQYLGNEGNAPTF
jgi:GTPase SAR1 family protein